MTQESKTEIVIFSGLAAFLAALWWMNRQAGAGTGLEGTSFLPDFSSGSSGVPNLSGTTPNAFNIGGDSYTGPVFNSTSPGSGGCGCSSCQPNGGAVAFGTSDDLASYLASGTASGAPSWWQDALQNWQ